MSSADGIDKKKLTNILNFLHFKGTPLYALLNHPQYEEEVLVKVHPEPCLGDDLICHWDQAYSGYRLERYHFQYLILSHDQSVILVPARILTVNQGGFTIQLPETSLATSKRMAARFRCHDVKAELWQSGFQAEGNLVDFSPHAFRVRVQAVPPASFYRFDTEAPSTLRLFNGSDVFYAGNCSHLYQQQNGRTLDIVVAPLQDQRIQYKSKRLRNPRKQSSPPLTAIFEHPFMKRTFQREIFDISTSGFSISDKSNEAVLIPGMIIPNMTIAFAGLLKIQCKTQVIHRKDESSTRFGIAILDMEIKDYNNLNQLLNNIPGIGQDMVNEVDPDLLWELFFDSDFIYPSKYKNIEAFREDFQVTYQKLYKDCPAIAKHFTYQKNGRIYSHISLLRAYERAWMVHHHAARAMDGRYTGLIVLKQMISYLYDLRRLPSAMLDYYICFFRPGNKFTDRIYAGFANEKDNPRACSLDSFTYLSHKMKSEASSMPEGWLLQACSSSDLWELEQFYMHHSGGLLGDVLDLKQHNQHTLEQVYALQGFHRKWQAIALHFSGDLKAVIIKEESDVAINLSDLLNGFKVFVMDSDIPLEVIFAAVENITKIQSAVSLPLLIYPASYTHSKDLQPEKHYIMWILNAQYANEFIEYLMRKFRMNLT